mgnify:CR=1 FL=1
MARATETNAGGPDDRVSVLIPARMRLGAQWSDIVIRNLSVTGLMADCAAPPRTGTYVEIRRGTQIIVGRVIWVRDRLFGIQSQERLPVRSIIDEPRLAHRPRVAIADGLADRRSSSRPATRAGLRWQAELSRLAGDRMQRIAIGIAILCMALLAATTAFDLLATPLHAARAAMGGNMPH